MSAATIRGLKDNSASKLTQLASNAAMAADPETKEGALKAYHAAFAARYDHLTNVLAAEGQKIDKTETEAQRMESEADAAEKEAARLTKELEDMDKAQGPSIRATPGAPYTAFLTARANLGVKLAGLDLLTSAILDGSALQISTNDAQELVDQWETRQAELSAELDDLTVTGASAKETSPSIGTDFSVDALATKWKLVQERMDTAKMKVSEHASKTAAYEASRRDFEFERKRLLVWCRQQKMNLDAMVEPDHVQEFCASLLTNYPTMEENFAVIYDRGASLLPSKAVEAAMLEVNEVWVNLQVSAFERLRHTLLEIHYQSKLEDEVRAFSTYSQRAGQFLEDFSKLLAMPTDEESQGVVKPVVESCTSLQRQFEQHQHLTDHLREFSLRMECLRDNYNGLRRAVLTRITFLPRGIPTTAASLRRKEEYIERMKELREWVDVKSRGCTWADVHAKVMNIRALVEQEMQSLQAPDKKDSPEKNGTQH